ncbi:hypothetical protein RCO48_05135 [Peribacillus frigoritolerans]|nr:hypothetical protein [Peribacillus frigoritolerans]
MAEPSTTNVWDAFGMSDKSASAFFNHFLAILNHGFFNFLKSIAIDIWLDWQCNSVKHLDFDSGIQLR